MTGYANFTHDFPTRCLEIYQILMDSDEEDNRDEEDNQIVTRKAVDGRDVTLLLAIACAGIVIPIDRFEELDNINSKKNIWKYKGGLFFSHKNELGECLDIKDIKFYRKKDKRIDRNCPANWRDNHIIPTDELRNNQVMYTLRHALAHGNLWTLPPPEEISHIWFSSKWNAKDGQVGWQAIRLSTENLRKLVENWFDYLKEAYAGNDTE